MLHLGFCFFLAATSCKQNEKTEKINAEKIHTSDSSITKKLADTIETNFEKKPIQFNEKFSSDKTPFSFSFVYKNHLYKFYAYAYYLLPNKKAKQKDGHLLEIIASKYEGPGGDDFNDGASLKIKEEIYSNATLHISGGYFCINSYKMMEIQNGQITITSSKPNIINGTFTATGVLKNNEGEKTKTTFTITNGKFENLPVMVHKVENLEEGWLDPTI